MKKTTLLTLSIVLTSWSLSAQTIELINVVLKRDYIEVEYSLEDANPNHLYQVDLYCSKDNFATPLTRVSGDVGPEVEPGESLTISWNAVKEIGGYQGELALEVRARVYIPFVKIASFGEDAKFKRGSAYPLLWESGNKGGQIDIELFKDQTRVDGDRNVPNSGKYEYVFPNCKPGKNYRLKFTNTRNRDETTSSVEFRIVPKIPLVLKVGGLAALAGGAYFLLNSGGDGSNNNNNNESDPLPTPPDFPDP